MRSGCTGAFFDFDKTLITVDSPRLGIRYLWERGLVSPLYILKVTAANLLYQANLLPEERMARLLISFYRGKPLEPFEAGARDYYEQVIRPHLAPNIVARVMDHREKGHTLVLISAGLRYLLKPVADGLGFHHLLCTDLEIGPDGLLTGRTLGPVCTEGRKRELAEKLARDLAVDLSASYAYGNHRSDIPLLELVGHARAVEPTRELRRTALERSWPILSFR